MSSDGSMPTKQATRGEIKASILFLSYPAPMSKACLSGLQYSAIQRGNALFTVVFADRIMMCVEIIVRLTRRPSKKIEIFHNLIESHELKASLLQTLDNCRKGRYRLRAITAAIVQDDDTS